MITTQLLGLTANCSENADADSRVLPAWFTANYFTLLPGEQRFVSVKCDSDIDVEDLELRVTGYNIAPVNVPVKMYSAVDDEESPRHTRLSNFV